MLGHALMILLLIILPLVSSGTQPLGGDVSIDPVTGLISGNGFLPKQGRYIVNVICIMEWATW
jgi:hypothetical protein